MIPQAINFIYLREASGHYSRAGWEYTESPWMVPASIIDITKPDKVVHPQQLKRTDFGMHFVASGEQSLLWLIKDGKLQPGKYQTLTPCYRGWDGQNDDGLHFSQFYKLELMWYKGQSEPASEELQSVIADVCRYLDAWPKLKYRQTVIEDEPRLDCKTDLAIDIEIECDGKWIEFGSYGIRYSEGYNEKRIGYWIYGTGLAEPRFNYILDHVYRTGSD